MYTSVREWSHCDPNVLLGATDPLARRAVPRMDLVCVSLARVALRGRSLRTVHRAHVEVHAMTVNGSALGYSSQWRKTLDNARGPFQIGCRIGTAQTFV